MGKYDPLWNWIKENGTESFKLTFSEIENIAGFPIDHSFFTSKKELIPYGYKVRKISMKEQTVSKTAVTEIKFIIHKIFQYEKHNFLFFAAVKKS